MLRELFSRMPPITKNLFLLCLVMFIAQISGETAFNGEGVTRKFAVYYFASPQFEPYQIITHIFCHGDFAHLAFNMIALISIGSLLEQVWGPKRYLTFYLITGLGAVVLHQLALGFDLYKTVGTWTAQGVVFDDSGTMNFAGSGYTEEQARKVYELYMTPTLGASGAIYGLLIGLAMMFPNIELALFFIPIPIKAKYLVPVLILIELTLGVKNYQFDNIAHFAHLGGALFGFILIKIWRRKHNRFY